jgi:hypothetical protein
VGQVKGKHDPFIEAIETAQGAHENPLLIAISTQAATDADLFSVWLDDAAASDDPKIVSHQHRRRVLDLAPGAVLSNGGFGISVTAKDWRLAQEPVTQKAAAAKAAKETGGRPGSSIRRRGRAGSCSPGSARGRHCRAPPARGH